MARKIGTVRALFSVSPDSGEQCEQTELTCVGDGIVGDKHYGKDVNRSILLSSSISYNIVQQAILVAMPKGYLGENILIDAPIYHLPIGTRLRIGDKVVIEITQNCTLCSHLGVLDKRIPKLLKNDRGIFAKTIREGTIRKGDAVVVLMHDETT
jgi:MOSC domain-containing protein YiiM